MPFVLDPTLGIEIWYDDGTAVAPAPTPQPDTGVIVTTPGGGFGLLPFPVAPIGIDYVVPTPENPIGIVIRQPGGGYPVPIDPGSIIPYIPPPGYVNPTDPITEAPGTPKEIVDVELQQWMLMLLMIALTSKRRNN